MSYHRMPLIVSHASEPTAAAAPEKWRAGCSRTDSERSRGRRARAALEAGLALATLLAASSPSTAAPGVLDASFGVGGVVTTAIGPGNDTARGVVVQGDGKVVVAGSSHNGADQDVVLARYDTAGVLDPTFGIGGIVTTAVGAGDDVAEAIALAPDGALVVGGWTANGSDNDVLLLRYWSNGVLDQSFGTGGIVQTVIPGGAEALAVLVEPNRDIVVAGRAATGLLLANYDEDGSLRTGFGDGGVVVTALGGPAAATSVVRTGSTGFLIAGWVRLADDADMVLARYQGDGDPRPSFGIGGVVITSLGAGDDIVEAVVQHQGGFVVAGSSPGTAGTDVVLARFDAAGALDPAFGSDGVARTALESSARALGLATDVGGKLLAAGWASSGTVARFALLRFEPSGNLDPTYGSGGVVTTPIGGGDAAAEAVAIGFDGRGVAAGRAANGNDDDIAVARYLGSPRCGNGLIEPEGGETCDDGNHSNGDCCGPTCQPDPAGTVCRDDGDPCTDERCDGAGSCVSSPTATACDAHLCYSARSTTPFASTPVTLSNAYGTDTGLARRPKALCPPAGVDGSPIDDSLVHQEAYDLRTPRRPYPQDVRVVDQFGTLRLRMIKADRLLVPTHEALDGPPPAAPSAGAANAFQCYRVKIAEDAPEFSAGIQAQVTDAFENRRYDVRDPKRLCVPVDANGAAMPNPLAHLVCYGVRAVPGEPTQGRVVGRIHTANALGAGELDTVREDELCVPALREPCGLLPPCAPLAGQSANCNYDPAVTDAAHPFCGGPKVLVDVTHDNFHVIETDGVAGRYWGFAKLLLNDGYDVQQTSEPVTTLLPSTDAAVWVIANPTTEDGPDAEAVPRQEVSAIVDWVRDGGSLLLIIDHEPFEQVGELLAAFGLVRLPAGIAPGFTFTRASGTLNAQSAVANGPGPDTMVDEVTTFTGTAFSPAAAPPAEAQMEPVLVFPPETTGTSNNEVVDIGGFLQGVAIRFGAGRVFVSGEAGGLSSQSTFGMQQTPENERYLRNILWWLTQ